MQQTTTVLFLHGVGDGDPECYCGAAIDDSLKLAGESPWLW